MKSSCQFIGFCSCRFIGLCFTFIIFTNLAWSGWMQQDVWTFIGGDIPCITGGKQYPEEWTKHLYVGDQAGVVSRGKYDFDHWDWYANPNPIGSAIYCITIGEGRQSSTYDYMYFGCSDGCIYELDGLAFDSSPTNMGSYEPGKIMKGIVVEDGRNISKKMVYAACDNVYEFSWESAGSSWTRTDVGSASMSMHSVCVGDGRNNSFNRVYATNSDGYIYEFTCTGGIWSSDKINSSSISNPTKIVMGDARNDGKNRLYVVSGDIINEYNYSGWVWYHTPLNSGGETSTINDIKIGKARNDGINRIYAGTNDGHIYEYKYDSNTNNWIKEPDVDFIGIWINCIAIGTPRGKGTGMRIYVGTGHDHEGNAYVYEFTYGEGYGTKDDLSNVHGYPTPFFPKDGQPMTFANVPPDAEINIYTINGILVKTINVVVEGAGWKGGNEDGEIVSSGTYIVCVTKGENQKIFKIMVIK